MLSFARRIALPLFRTATAAAETTTAECPADSKTIAPQTRDPLARLRGIVALSRSPWASERALIKSLAEVLIEIHEKDRAAAAGMPGDGAMKSTNATPGGKHLRFANFHPRRLLVGEVPAVVSPGIPPCGY